MKHQEQKYQVDSFDTILKRLDELGAETGAMSESTHYYTRQPTNDVVKLVVHGDQAAIHKLRERGGNFDLVENLPMANADAGLRELQNQSYRTLDVVRMVHTDYSYKGGIVGLYTINDSLNSVVLDYPAGQHATVESDLHLQTAAHIEIPYNKYLEKIGKLQSIVLE